jgi:hypothetical protein
VRISSSVFAINLLAASLLAGCASGGSAVAPGSDMRMPAARTSNATSSHSGNPNITCNAAPALLYASITNLNVVNIYPNPQNTGNPAPVATISPSQGLLNPEGMTVHGSVLYVANSAGQNVLLFKKCGSGPGASLVDAPYTPVDVAVSSNTTVYVSNSSSTVANVTVFPTGNLNYNPSLTLTDPNARSAAGITIDKFGNCFWDFIDTSGAGQVEEFPGCTMPGTVLSLFTPVRNPIGNQMDWPSNHLVVNDAGVSMTYRIASPYTGPPFAFGLPGFPEYLALRQNEARLYVADAKNGVVQRYKYPSGVAQPPITNGLSPSNPPIGVAVWPPAPL